ncbi:MAG: PAS domain S-box protein [Syntrophobacter sp.]
MVDTHESKSPIGRFRHQFQGKLIILLVILLLPNLAIQTYLYLDRFEELRAEAFQENLEIARAVAKTFQTFVQDALHQELTIGLAITSSVPMTPEDITRLLKESNIDHASIRDFSWTNPEGTFVYSSNPAMIGANNSDRSYFRDIVSGREWTVGELVLARTTGQPVFGISRGIRDGSGTLLGVVVATILPEQVESLFSIDRGKDGALSIIDNKGMLVCRYPALELKWDERNWAERYPEITKVFQGKELSLTMASAFGAKDRLVAVTPAGTLGWAVAAERSQAEVMAGVRASLLRQTALYLVVTFLAFALALVFSRSLSNSVRKLRQHALALGRGETGELSITANIAEIADLADAFNTMAEKVKTRELTLRLSEERLRGVGDNIPGGAIFQQVRHPDGRLSYAYMSAGIERLVGISVEDLLADPDALEKTIHEDDLAHCLEVERKSALHITPLELEFRQRSPSGEVKWLQCRATPRRLDDGSILWDGVVMDITERKRLEQAVRESESRYRELVENANSAILRWKHDGTITFFNEFAERFFGYRADEVIGRDVELLLPEQESMGGDLSMLAQRIVDRPEQYITHINENVRRDGSRVWMAWTNRAILGKDGQVSEILAVGSDITERKLAEDALHRQTALIRGINKVLREALVSETEEELAGTCLAVAEELTGSEFGFLGEVNDKGLFYNIALSDPGWEACRMPGDNATSLIHDMEIRGIWGKTLLDEITVIANDPLIHPDRVGIPDGHPPLKSFLGVPIKSTGHAFGMIALANKDGGYDQFDASAIESLGVAFAEALSRKRAEEGLRRSHQELEARVLARTADLERSNRALQDFASIASHDLKEPLRKIISFGNILEQKHSDSIGASGNEYLRRITAASQRMQSLITALLEYSKITANTEHFGKVDLSEIVRDVIMDLEVRIESSGGKVLVGDLPVVEADPVQMRQLFQNLIANALKFHGEGKRPLVKVGLSAELGHAPRIVIEDNGIGFDEEHVETIFAPFHRLHGKSSRYEGTGMGLAICRKIVEQHGWSITARSQPGIGSSFIISIPSLQ